MGDLGTVFKHIYNSNTWNSTESISGEGSELKATENLRKELGALLKDYEIKSIYDAPCGDFNWMKEMDLNNIDYIGSDIVDNIITKNKEKYPNYNFTISDITKDKIPNVDLIFTRDCLVHLNYENIKKFITNIKNSGSKYLLTTSFEKKDNRDIVNGDWRPINLRLPPFKFGEPLYVIDEKCVESYPNYIDKTMVLYEIQNINY